MASLLYGVEPTDPVTFGTMIAVLLASMPLMALLHPAVPVTVRDWQVGLTMAGVWFVAFLVQRLRYERFQARVARKVARIA